MRMATGPTTNGPICVKRPVVKINAIPKFAKTMYLVSKVFLRQANIPGNFVPSSVAAASGRTLAYLPVLEQQKQHTMPPQLNGMASLPVLDARKRPVRMWPAGSTSQTRRRQCKVLWFHHAKDGFFQRRERMQLLCCGSDGCKSFVHSSGVRKMSLRISDIVAALCDCRPIVLGGSIPASNIVVVDAEYQMPLGKTLFRTRCI